MNEPADQHSPKRWRLFRRAEGGSVAVEFALLAIPFFTIIFAIVETAIVFFASASLEGALNDAARQIRTGQIQTAGTGASAMRTAICANAALLSNCTTDLKLDVRSFSSWASVSVPQPLTNGNLTIAQQFTPGSASDIVIVRAYFQWKILSPVAIGLNNMNGSYRLIGATVAFRNEPYSG
jgi:Flp pilus assembly protein TadG